VLWALGETRRETPKKEIRMLSDGIYENKTLGDDTSAERTESPPVKGQKSE